MIHMNKGRKIVACARVGGANTTPILAAHFAKRNTKNCDGKKARAGREFLSPQPPFLPAPPERSVWRAKRAVSFAQRNFEQSLRFPTNRNFRRFGEGLPRGFAARHSGFAPCAKPKNPTAAKKKWKWICLFRI